MATRVEVAQTSKFGSYLIFKWGIGSARRFLDTWGVAAIV
jgi:hypothetical protein